MDFHQVKAESIQVIKEASISFLATWYFKLLLKIAICSQNLWFFNQCSRKGVFPNYMKLRTNNKSKAAQIGATNGLKKWLSTEKKSQFQKRGIYNIYLKVVHTELLNKLHFVEFLVLDGDTREKVSKIINKKYLTQRKKLKTLTSKSNTIKLKPCQTTFSDHKFHSRFVNLSKTDFSKNEVNLLEKGFKHNIQNININSLEILGVDTDLALKDTPNNIKYKFDSSTLIKNQFMKETSPKQETKLIKQIKNKSDNIVFTKADKGNTVIAIDKTDYIQKTLDFLDPTKYIHLKTDPTNKYQKIIKNIVVNCKSLFSEIDLYKLTLMNPLPPKLYSLLKIHKIGNPIRPVVSFFSAPSYKLSKCLINLININTNFSAKYAIKNSYDLVNKIKDITLPNNAKLVSFDVANLFPSIPLKDTVKLVEKLLVNNNVNSVKKQELVNALEACLEQNYFEFNDKLYTSKEGLIMGNPLSPLLAEIFMDYIESIISKNPLFEKFIYWYRYVDDVLACFTGTERQLDNFLDFINSIHNNIKFTIEKEHNNSINFLDLSINKINNKHNFAVFHKPTHTDMTIHNTSCHPIQHKLASFFSMIHRLITLPLNKFNFQKELNIIKQIAVNNGYTPKIIDKMLNKKLYKKAINLVFPTVKESKNNYKVITYLGHISNKIANFLKNININVAFRSINNLGKYIKNNKTKTNKGKKSGVYKLKCNDCPKIYIGQTGRNFDKRINEHHSSFLKKKKDSNYSNHLIDEQHAFNFDYDILHCENKSLKLNLLESMEINKHKNSNTLLNDQLDLNSSPLLNLFC